MCSKLFLGGRGKRRSSICSRCTNKAKACWREKVWRKLSIMCTSFRNTACTRRWSTTNETHSGLGETVLLPARQAGDGPAMHGAQVLSVHSLGLPAADKIDRAAGCRGKPKAPG